MNARAEIERWGLGVVVLAVVLTVWAPWAWYWKVLGWLILLRR